MKQYREQLFQPYRCEDLFDLVADIESYPEFIPGWQSVRVLDSGDNWLAVEQTIGLGPAHLVFTSRATFKRPQTIHIESTGRPFERLCIDWHFSPRTAGCLVEFVSSLQLATMHGLAAPMLELMGKPVIQAFKDRAANKLRFMQQTLD